MRRAGYLVALVLLLAGPTEAGVGLPEIASIQIGPHRVHVLNDSVGLRRGRNMLTVRVPDLPPGHGVALELRGPGGEVVAVPLRALRVLGDPGGAHRALAAVAAADASSHPGAPGGDGERHDHARDLTTRPATTQGAPPGDPAHAASLHGDHAHGAPAPGPAVREHAVRRAPADGAPPPGPATRGVADHDATGREGAGHGGASHGAGHDGGGLAGLAVRGVARLPSTGAWRAVLTIGDGRGEPLAGEFRVDVAEDGPSRLYLGGMGLLTGGSLLYGVIRRRRGEGRA